jgi:hypothetical protein
MPRPKEMMRDGGEMETTLSPSPYPTEKSSRRRLAGGHIATLETRENWLPRVTSSPRSGHIATLETHICRAYAARYGTASSTVYLAYPYLSGGGVCRSAGILTALEVDAQLRPEPRRTPASQTYKMLLPPR